MNIFELFTGRMKFIVLIFLLLASRLHALDGEAIRGLAAEPHDREGLIEELAIYPEAREYRVTIQFRVPGGEPETLPEMVAREKTVRGRYIVSEMRAPGEKESIIMVATYDKTTDTFKKWVLLPNGIVASSTGVADLKMRTIAWVSDEPQGDPPTTVLAIETHSDSKSVWKETILHKGGSVKGVSEGVAVKTK